MRVYVFTETGTNVLTKDECKKLENEFKEALKRATAATESLKKKLSKLHGKKTEDWPPGEWDRLLEVAQVQVDAQQELDAFRREEGLNDSTRRLKGSLKGKDHVQLTETPNDALVSIQILDRWKGAQGRFVKIRVSLCRTLSPAELYDLSPIEWVRAGGVKTRGPVVHAYTDEEPYWDVVYFGGIAFRNATRHMAGCINKFIKENYELFSELKPRLDPPSPVGYWDAETPIIGSALFLQASAMELEPLRVHIFAETRTADLTKKESKSLEKSLKAALERAEDFADSLGKTTKRLHGERARNWPPEEWARMEKALQTVVEAKKDLQEFRSGKRLDDSVQELRGKLKKQDHVLLAETPDDALVYVQILEDSSFLNPRTNYMNLRARARISLKSTLPPAALEEVSSISWTRMNASGAAEWTSDPVAHGYTREEPYWDVMWFVDVLDRGTMASVIAVSIDKFIKDNYATLLGLMPNAPHVNTARSAANPRNRCDRKLWPLW